MKQSRAPGHFRVEFFVAASGLFITKKGEETEGESKVTGIDLFSRSSYWPV